jgi:iron complex transport system substrate-binding protein
LPRIVSLIATATEIVHALGELDHLVGRSHECDYPAEVLSLPVCTEPRIAVDGDSREIDRLVKEAVREAISVYRVFDDVLERLQPTHIITQVQCEVCAVSLRDVEESVARRLASAPQIVPLSPNSLADIWDDIRRVARSLEIEERGDALIARLQQSMREISARAEAQPERPRVACIEWIEPLMAIGNWTPELVRMARGVNLFGEAGAHSPWMTWEQLVERDPDVIVTMPCGFDLERTSGEMHWLTDRPGWRDLRAVRSGQVYISDGNQFFNRPGPRVVESLQILAEILHPALRLAYTESCESDPSFSSRWRFWPPTTP